MSKRTLEAWRRLGYGFAASAVMLAALAVGAIAVVSAPVEDENSQTKVLSFEPGAFSKAAAEVDQTAPPSPTPQPTPVPTAQPTPEPTPAPVTEPPPVTAAPVARPAAAPPTPPPPPPPAHGYRPDMAQTILELLNQERATAGVGGVVSNGSLQAAADYYAKLHFTTANPYQLNHSLDGGPGNRAWARGYCCAVGEILVTSEGSASGMVDLWMDSPSHRAVIVDPQYSEIGVSCYGGEYHSPDGPIGHPVLCSADFGAGGG
jgi:uncharacterized protein YkwD